MTLAEILTLAVAACGVLAGMWATLRARRSVNSRLELVDVALTDPHSIGELREEYEAARKLASWNEGVEYVDQILDVKVRNTGGQPAVVKRVHLCIDAAAEYDEDISLTPPVWEEREREVSALHPSQAYKAALPPAKHASGVRLAVNVSQAIAANEVDRFLVQFGPPDLREERWVLYLLRVEVHVNRKNRALTSPRIAVAFPDRHAVHGVDQCERRIRHFWSRVAMGRAAIDAALRAYAAPAVKWDGDDPPRSFSQIEGAERISKEKFDPASREARLLSRRPTEMKSQRRDERFDVMNLNQNDFFPSFWHPEDAVARYLHAVEADLRQQSTLMGSAEVRSELSELNLRGAEQLLSQIPRLRQLRG
ncbi:hypothetical protein ACIBHY_29560 [Nonomuraea sp. NPDC050547]|uniref:hypothetical protein n=1 Tax=Nonomuraea sp. NPDC050547 TaxID=3364368 RepID=UPI00379D5984